MCGHSCCSFRTGLDVVFGLLAVFGGFCYNARLNVQLPCQPFPTPEVLAEAGISLFERPSDGGKLEWLEYGAIGDPNAVVWLVVHGAVSTGGIFGIYPNFDQRMREKNVRVIAPTMPGWGTSDGYEPLFDITNRAWLERWRQDALALVDSLNVDKFWVSGMSLGGPPALALAEVAQSKHRLLGVAPLISSMWSHVGFDGTQAANHSFFSNAALSVLVNPYTGSLAAQAIRFLILRTTNEGFLTSPMVPATVGWDKEKWGMDLQRAVRFQLSGQVQSNRLVALSSTDSLIDWSKFTEDVPVVIFFGTDDDTVLPVVATFAASKLPWARLVPFPGGHLELDIFSVVDALFV